MRWQIVFKILLIILLILLAAPLLGALAMMATGGRLMPQNARHGAWRKGCIGHHVRQGKHGARSTKQAIAIGLSKASRAGVELPPPAEGKTSEETRRSAEYALRRARSGRKPSSRRARAIQRALRREGPGAASPKALAQQARSAARRRGAGSLKAAARKAVRTKGRAGRARAAGKAARTRARRGWMSG